MPEQHAIDDPFQEVRVRIRLSKWRKILQIARVEQRDPRPQAGVLLEWAADEWPATRAVAEVA